MKKKKKNNVHQQNLYCNDILNKKYTKNIDTFG